MVQFYKKSAFISIVCLLTAALSCLTVMQQAQGQCRSLADPFNFNRPTTSPKPYPSCLPANSPTRSSTFRASLDGYASNVVITWGDGSSNTYTASQYAFTHTYTDTGTFTYTIRQTGCPDIVGKYLNYLNASSPGIGFVFPPAGSDNKRCLPATVGIQNVSPNMQPYTRFLVDWGLNEKKDTLDRSSAGQFLYHTYKKGSKLCRTRMTVTYFNVCGVPPNSAPLVQTAGDYFFIDKDTAMSSPAKIVICQPEVITINDASRLHCLDTSSRKLAWSAESGFAAPLGVPVDGVFRPYGNQNSKHITITPGQLLPVPADSTYKLKLFIRNMCGTDTTDIKIIYASPRQPMVTPSSMLTCPGDVVAFNNTTVNPYEPGVMKFIYDWGDGTPRETNNLPTVSHAFMIGGTYNVTVTSVVESTVSGRECSKVTRLTINVRNTITPRIISTPHGGCGLGVIKVKNGSINTNSAVWLRWQLDDSPVFNAGSSYYPQRVSGQDTSAIAIRSINTADSSAMVAFKRYGRYIISLTAQSAVCPAITGHDTIDIYPQPTLRWHVSSPRTCVGAPITIRDSSIIYATDTNGLPQNFRGITWKLEMGDTAIVRSTGPVLSNFDAVVATGRLTQYAYSQPGSYLVRLTVWAGGQQCPKVDTFRVFVQPSPVPVMGIVKNRCQNQQLIFKNLMRDSADYYSYEVFRGNRHSASLITNTKNDFIATLPYVPPGDSTYYTVYLQAYTINGGDTCTSISAPTRISVAPTPVAAIAVTPASDGCSPMRNVNFTNTSFNLAYDSLNTFTWSFGNGQTSTQENPAAQTYVNNGLVLKKDTVTFSIHRSDGCLFTVQREILIFPGPNAVLQGQDSVCSGDTVHLAATGNSLQSFTWSFPDYDQSNTFYPAPSKVFTNFDTIAHVYTVQLDVRNISNCQQTLTKRIKVFPQPRVDVTTALTQNNHCSPLPVRFNISNPTGASLFKWYFTSTDSATYRSDSSFTRTYSNDGAAPISHTIRLIASNGGRCSTTVNRAIVVNPAVRADFTLNSQAACHPFMMQAVNNGSVGGDRLIWTVGNATINNQQSVSQALYNQSTSRDSTITVRLIASNSLAGFCRDTAIKTIQVHPKPVITSVAIPFAYGCSPFTAPIAVNANGVETYNWDFGDGSSQVDSTGRQTHTYENYNPTADRNYTIQVVGANQFGCSDTSTKTVSVKPFIKAGIQWVDSVGCSPFTVQASSAPSVNANSFEWQFGNQNTSSLPNPVVTLTNASDTVEHIQVRLVAAKTQITGCPDTAYRTLTIYPKPIVGFTASTNLGCGPLPVRFTASTQRTARTMWILSSGGVSDTIYDRAVLDTVISNPNLVNKSLKVELVGLSAQGCETRTSQFVTVYADVAVRFELDQEGCEPFRTQVTNRSSNNGGAYLWQFGDGNTSSSRNPEHVYSYGRSGDTTYYIKLTAVSPIGQCSRTDSLPVVVHGRPVNAFAITSGRRIQLPANTLTIQNNTPYHNDWHTKWYFGDLQTDTTRARNFSHIYDFNNQDFTDTNFVITQVCWSDYGCSDTLREPIIIQPEAPVPNFTMADSVGCSPLSIAFYNKSTYGREYLWDFGDRGISDEKNPVHVYTAAGKYTVSLKVSGFGGVRTIVRDTIIYVRPFPSATFRVTNQRPDEVIIPEETAAFKVLSPCYDCTYDWDFGDGTRSSEINPSHLYQTTDTWTVSLRVIAPSGCGDQDTVRRALTTIAKRVVQAPNVFKPDRAGPSGGNTSPDDTRNTVFYPFTQGAVSINLQIFNRWGNLLYASKTINKGWDGYVNGGMAPADTYVYLLDVTFLNGEHKQVYGDVTLVH